MPHLEWRSGWSSSSSSSSIASSECTSDNGEDSDLESILEDVDAGWLDLDDFLVSASSANNSRGVDPEHLSKIWRISHDEATAAATQ